MLLADVAEGVSALEEGRTVDEDERLLELSIVGSVDNELADVVCVLLKAVWVGDEGAAVGVVFCTVSECVVDEEDGGVDVVVGLLSEPPLPTRFQLPYTSLL